MGKVIFGGLGADGFLSGEDDVGAGGSFSDRAELLRNRVDFLTGHDRVLMRMYLDNGVSFSQMARLAGVNEATISRRIYKLTVRLLNGDYICCLRNRGKLSKLELGIARDLLVNGFSQRKISAKRKVSIYRVRVSVSKIRASIENS